MRRIYHKPACRIALRKSTRSGSQGLDVRNSSPSNAREECFFLDIPFYRIRKFKIASKRAPPARGRESRRSV